MQRAGSLDLDPNKYYTVLDQWLSNPPLPHKTLDQLPRVDNANLSWKWSTQTGYDMLINCKRNDTNRVQVKLISLPTICFGY